MCYFYNIGAIRYTSKDNLGMQNPVVLCGMTPKYFSLSQHAYIGKRNGMPHTKIVALYIYLQENIFG